MSNAQSPKDTDSQASTSPTILLVDDDADMLSLLSRWLEKAGFNTIQATNGRDALVKFSLETPQLVITDLVMEGMDGLGVLTEIHQQNPVMPVIMLSGQAEIPDAVRATHMGAAAFLTKPVNREELVLQARRATQYIDTDQGAGAGSFAPELIYRSTVMADLLATAQRIAMTDSPVFIAGPTGSGKEVLARAIHDGSPRRDHPFIGVNCGAIPEQLLESELFGHEKGAFTGATARHQGLFKAADGGTLFLDEIGDMPLMLQVKLLRVLQDYQVRPVGSTQSIPIDVRIISATHQDLDEAVSQGEFREDLYYRLNVLPIELPGLAGRREDIPLLIDSFLVRHAEKYGGKRKRFAPDALDYLIAAPWPGNVRQLANVVEHCVALSASDLIPLTQAQTALREQQVGVQTLDEAKMAFERNYIISILRLANGNVASATRLAGRNRTDFYKLLNRHQIEPATFRPPKAGDAGAED